MKNLAIIDESKDIITKEYMEGYYGAILGENSLILGNYKINFNVGTDKLEVLYIG